MKRSFLLTLIFSASLFAGPFTLKQSPNLKVDFDKAVQLLNSGDLKTADIELQKILRLDPRYIPAIVALADIRVREGQPVAAQALFAKALALDPKGAELQRSYARFLLSQNKVAPAIQALTKASLAKPSAEVHQELASALLAGQKPALALTEFQKAQILDPNNPSLHLGIGTALAVLNKMPEAEAKFLKAATLAPADPRILLPIALHYRERGNPSKAEELIRKILTAEPKNPSALLAFGDLQASRNEIPKALALYSQSASISPAVPAYLRIGTLQQQAGKFSEAEAAYRKAIQLDATAVIAYNNLAFLLLTQKRQLEEAETLSRKAVSLTPANAGFHDTLAMILNARGNTNAAILQLEKAALLKQQSPEVLYHLGTLYADKGKTALARTHLTRALALSKTFDGAAEAQRILTSLGR